MTACPACGGTMSTAIHSQRTGMWNAVCRSCGYFSQSATPVTRPAPEPTHGAMFTPSTSQPEPPRPRDGAMQTFDRAVAAGTVRKAIQGARKQAAEANVDDPRMQQLPRGDR